MNNEIKKFAKMKCNVICTYDKWDEDYERQTSYDFEVFVCEDDSDLKSFITDKFFKEIAKIVRRDKRGVGWLYCVSTACDWFVYEDITKNMFDMNEINNGKWQFAECSKMQFKEGSLTWQLKQKYGFGTKCDSSWFWDNEHDSDKSMDAFLTYLHKNNGLEWIGNNAI